MFLNLLLDIILLTVLIGGACYGYKRGLFRFAAGALRGVICFFLSISLCDYIGKNFISPLIGAPITNYLLDFFEKNITAEVDGIVNRIPTVLKIANAVFGDGNEVYEMDMTLDRVIEFVGEPLIALISRILAFILIFFGLKYVIKLLVSLLDSIFNLGIIGWLNRLVGSLLSICVGFFVCWAFCSLTEYLLHLEIFAASRLVQNFGGGILYRFFKKFSLLSLLFSF